MCIMRVYFCVDVCVLGVCFSVDVYGEVIFV